MKHLLIGLLSFFLTAGFAKAADPVIGASLYGSICQGCHGPMTNLPGRTAAQIQSAINLNLGGMLAIGGLTNAQIADVASALPPLPPAGPVDPQAEALYVANCGSCHGPLATSTKRGRTATQIQNAITANIGGMGTISLTAQQITDIAGALFGSVPPPPDTGEG
jgi:mono/diheme cytochrome c family protein